ncbi:hypothetical protein SAMN04487905_111150 [Actinopolyspora xinjiangensis]|uniref:Uncharacterized protein n=2 Tax=Actinopolyspora xinjiangensis TaxID=405564 RepID=A0A1H0WBJ1_9ACTN|nr:hypothetical protein [Actinopolyspora xinjiangensis]SDP87923.1 hypothetical protein SAMN04487905_111150 [Actinopolyspora xinjiangensis]
MPQARELAGRLGQTPSRNRLMSEFRIGARKATTVRAQLDSESETAGSAGADQSVQQPVQPEPGESAPGVDIDETDSDSLPSEEPLTHETETTEDAEADPDSSPSETSEEAEEAASASEQDTPVANPEPGERSAPASTARVPAAWPVLLLALPAFVAIWSGWVGLGSLTGFGVVHPLPGIWDSLRINTAITLPIGVETYAAYALRVWLSGRVPAQARRFAKWSALGSLALGGAGQVAYHLMTAAGMTHAPWPITTAVSCLPVAVLGMGAALTHLLHSSPEREREAH